MKLFKLLILLLLLTGCKTKKEVITQYVKVDSIVYQQSLVTKYDTLKLPSDSAVIRAYFECDSAGNVLIRELNEEKGKFKVKTVFKDNFIKMLVSVDSATIIRNAEQEFIKKYNVTSETAKDTTIKKTSFPWWVFYGLGVLSIVIINILKNSILTSFKKYLL